MTGTSLVPRLKKEEGCLGNMAGQRQDMREMYSVFLTLLSSLANVATSNTNRFPCSETAPM